MSFCRVCVCVCARFRRQRLLSCICGGCCCCCCYWPTLFIYILFHFILFHFMLAFFCFSFLLLLSRAGVMNCFTYTLNMQHMFLAVDVLNIYMQSPCPYCGTCVASVSVSSKCVCVYLPQITFGLLQLVSRLSMRSQLAASLWRQYTLRCTMSAKSFGTTCWYPNQ